MKINAIYIYCINKKNWWVNSFIHSFVYICREKFVDV